MFGLPIEQLLLFIALHCIAHFTVENKKKIKYNIETFALCFAALSYYHKTKHFFVISHQKSIQWH